MRVNIITKKQVDVPDLSDRIRTARKLKFKSVKAAAKAIGRHHNWLTGIETGRTDEIAIATLKEIENVLDTNFGVEI